jgi:hypothetical protein
MPIDTSSYPNQPQQPNVLGTLGGVAQFQNLMNQNKLFQQQFNSNLGLSQIYKEAINPRTGELDPNKLQGLMAGPNANSVTLGLPQAIAQSQEAHQRNISINSAELTNARQHLEAVSGYIAPLIAEGANPTSSDVMSALAHAGSVGLAKPEELSRIYSTLPRLPNGQIDESQIKAWALQQQLNVMSASERLNALSPSPTLIQNGQQAIPMRLPQIGAPTQAGPGVQMEIPPTAQRYNPITKQREYVGPGGVQGGGQGGPQAAPGGGAPWAGGSARPGGGLATGPALGAAEAAGVTATNAAQAGVNLNKVADQIPEQKAILGNLEGALNKFTSGPGADWKKVAGSMVNQNLQSFGFKGFAPDKIASQEEFTKQASMLAQNQFKQLEGTGTDRQLDSTMSTSPNTALSKMGNQRIIALLKGNADAIGAKRQAWQQWQQAGKGPESYHEFSTAFNKDWDPRAFQLQYLQPKEAKEMLGGMNANEKKDFNRVMNIGVKNGWVQLPSWLQSNGK